MKQKQIAIHNHNLADQLLRGISIIFSEEKQVKVTSNKYGITILIYLKMKRKNTISKKNKMNLKALKQED